MHYRYVLKGLRHHYNRALVNILDSDGLFTSPLEV
jgi:hypothetical protein